MAADYGLRVVLIERAGFKIECLDTYCFAGGPKMFGYTFEGVARKA